MHTTMDFGSWNVCEQTVVLQGAFLLAEKLIHPKTLVETKKSDWPLIEKPITDALKEICLVSQSQNQEWKKRAIAVLWAKILCCRPDLSLDPDMNIERKWKEDVFFPVEKMIPKINHTVLFELLKTTKAAKIFAELLLAFPPDFWVDEADLMMHHVVEETSLADVTFFLDIWWEILKSSNDRQDETVKLFGDIICQYLTKSTDELCQRTKRFKPDPEQFLPPADNILTIFIEGLHKIRQYIDNSELKCYTVANLTEMLCSSAFIEETQCLPIGLYLEKIVAVLSFWNTGSKNQCHNYNFLEMLKEAERTIKSGSTASRFKLLHGAQHFGLNILKDLLHQWGDEIQNYMNSSKDLGYESYRMADSLLCLHKILIDLRDTDTFPEEQRGNALELVHSITSLQEKTVNVQLKRSTDDSTTIATVAMSIIENKMDRYKEVCSLFASEVSWAFSEDWINCLKRNKAHFQEPDLIFKLLETVSKATSLQSNVSIEQKQNATNFILNLFAELSLSEMDNVLQRVLSSWGKKGLSQSMKAFTNDFQEELNTTFNQISQSVSDYSAAKAVSKVAKLALLYPEAVVNKACHFAVINLGAHTFLAKILISLPALRFRTIINGETSVSLLSQCLIDTCWGKLSSAKEESQFLYLLAFLMNPSETQDSTAVILLQPAEVVRTFVLPYILDDSFNIELCLQILQKALTFQNSVDESGKHWILSCAPFPLIMSLCKLLNSFTKYWQHSEQKCFLTLGSKELIIDILSIICSLILPEAENSPETWNKSLFWLHRKMEHLDWVIHLRLKPIYGEHFKNGVPSQLFEVCKLSEYDWTALDLPEYGPGTGLLAWLECCCISSNMKDQMLSLLSVNRKNPEEVNLFSKGFLVAMIQILPWCSITESKLLAQVAMTLLQRQLLHVPYTLEYVQYMPLLNLRPFAFNLQLSILLLRGFQLLCSSSCSDWLSQEGQKHIARLYSSCMSDVLESIKQQLANNNEIQEGKKETNYVQEVSFIYTQLFCHVLHIIAMMPVDTCEPLYILALEILSLYETLGATDTSTNSLLRRANERHFLTSITENVVNEQHRAALLQKISKL
ncbi:gem-associated protein 4 [Bombina bombina]|uniref:gem-associated protein 4 n=1 Tax=Bombina bombina TaxID=8345 RepID=UPI00235AFED4|nr:gem-associated protein 4 [Bombina bombina]